MVRLRGELLFHLSLHTIAKQQLISPSPSHTNGDVPYLVVHSVLHMSGIVTCRMKQGDDFL